ncbi:hypothetical protein [Marinibactrum halimedae]|uniref:Uncharacterized protein n=1 Tax=Marinibactrum halimedae TaxID=1444977 RepID=A0AA37TC47_9GAMM|nr:hypothetical protein [Marinibactrum halimedae]MCD9461205.1 hypothetical protein [Marinibactrum halimedae]GLS26427.1 hypothetical protein GCM10007877_21430 [Marinibactrum halimedae]
MKLRLPKSRTLKTDLSVITFITTLLYIKIEVIFRLLLGNSFDSPASEVGLSLIFGYIFGFILFYAVLISLAIKLGRYIAAKVFGLKTGVDFIEVDL